MEYTCNTVPTMGECTWRDTGCNAINGETIQFLDRHNAQCHAGEIMTGWDMTEAGCSGNNRKIAYQCCRAQKCPVNSKWDFGVNQCICDDVYRNTANGATVRCRPSPNVSVLTNTVLTLLILLPYSPRLCLWMVCAESHTMST